jgi:polysaccharide pyruvyl transferase WcaK-like protein
MNILFLADVSGEVSHVGDEAMLEANLQLFRGLFPECRATVAAGAGWRSPQRGVESIQRLEFAPHSETEREAQLESLRTSADHDHPAVAAVLAADLLVISGGGNLSGSWPHHLYERVAMARLAASKGIPIVLLGQTLGPEFHPHERDLASELLRWCGWVGVRETYSYALALELGVPSEKLSYQLDDATWLAPEPVPSETLRRIGIPEGRPWMGVTFHPLAEPKVQDRVVRLLAASLREVARSTGAPLIFLPHVEFHKRGGQVSDASFGEIVGRALYNNPPLYQTPLLSASQCLWLTQQASLVISSRYHPVVFALAGAVPSVALWTTEYTRRKLQGAMIHAQRPQDALSLEEGISGGLVSKVLERWESRELWKAEQTSRIEAWRVSEDQRRNQLKSRILSLRQ